MADYYTLLTDAGIAYETACKAAGIPIKLAQISVGDGNGAIYNPDATAKALKREVWRGPLNALFQDQKNANWLMAEVTIPSDVGGWYVREAGLWTDTGILYAIVKYPESYKPLLETSGAGKEFYIRSIFETTNASLVTLLIDDTVVKATRAWVMDYVAKATYTKAEVDAMTAQATEVNRGTARISTPAHINQGLDDSTIVTPKKLRLGFSISLGAQSYMVFPSWLGGLILQMGNSAIVTGSTDVSFPIAFPNRCIWVSEHDNTGPGGAMKAVWQFRAITKTGLNALNMGTLTQGSTTFNGPTASGCVYFAIGY